MTPFAQHLANAYFHANVTHIAAGNGKLTKGKFMQQAYPNQKYKNEASARRQFNKVTSERGGKGVETSGVKIEQRGRVKGPGMREEGLWKVYVHFKHLVPNEEVEEVAPLWPCKDKICNGNYQYLLDAEESPPIDYEPWEPPNTHCAIRNFTMHSKRYVRLEDVPWIYALLPRILNRKMRQWIESGSLPPVYWDVAAIVKPIARTDLTYDRQMHLDDIEVGGELDDDDDDEYGDY